MAFSLNVHLEGYEYRTLRAGVGPKGPWLSLVLENTEDARQLDVSVPKDMQADVYNLGLKKGDILSLDVVAVCANSQRQHRQQRRERVCHPSSIPDCKRQLACPSAR